MITDFSTLDPVTLTPLPPTNGEVAVLDVQFDLTKNPGPLLTSWIKGNASALPQEWQAMIGFRQEDQQMPLGYQLAPVTGIVLEQRLIQTRTDERKRTSLVLNDAPGIGPPPPGGGPPGSWMMIEEVRLPQGQIATRTKSFQPDLHPQDSHLLLTDDMIQAEQKNLGLGALEQTVMEAPLVTAPPIVDSKFDDLGSLVHVTKKRKLISLINEGETFGTGAGAGTGGIEAPSITPTRIRTTREGETTTVATEVLTVDPIPGATVQGFRIDNDGGIVTLNKTRKKTDQINEGNTATSILQTKTYADGETGNVAIEIVELRTLPGLAVISYRIDPDGGVVTITKTKKKTSDINESNTATLTLWTKIFGESEDGVVTIEVVETKVLPGPIVKSSRLDPDSIVVFITKQLMKETAVVQSEVLDGDNWVKSFKEGVDGAVAIQVIETRTALGYGLSEGQISPDLEVVSIVKTQRKQSDITPEAHTNGMQLFTTEKKAVSALIGQEVHSFKTVTNKPVLGQSRPNPIPDQFKPFVIIDEVSNITNIPVHDPILAQDDIEGTEQQIDGFFKRVTSKSFDPNLPIRIFEREVLEQYGGVLVNVEKILDSATAPGIAVDIDDVDDFGTVRAKQTRCGRFILREKASVVGGYPILVGGDIDAELNIAVPYTQQVVPAGTAGGIVGNSAIEVKPIDAARSLKTIRSAPVAALNAYKITLPGTTNIDFPNQLMSLSGVVAQKAGGAGGHQQTGNFTIFNRGSGAISLQSQAHCSAACLFDLIPVIKQTWGQGVPCVHWLFFVPGPLPTYASVLAKLNAIGGGGVQAWPKFKPQSAQFTCKGTKIAGTCEADIHQTADVLTDYNGDIQGASGSEVRGIGSSFDVEVTVKSVTIPPTIHGPIGVGGDGVSTSQTCRATALAQTTFAAPADTGTLTAQASIVPSSLPATPGQSAIPTAGNFLYQMRVEPYKYGFFKCDCLVVNASGWT